MLNKQRSLEGNNRPGVGHFEQNLPFRAVFDLVGKAKTIKGVLSVGVLPAGRHGVTLNPRHEPRNQSGFRRWVPLEQTIGRLHAPPQRQVGQKNPQELRLGGSFVGTTGTPDLRCQWS